MYVIFLFSIYAVFLSNVHSDLAPSQARFFMLLIRDPLHAYSGAFCSDVYGFDQFRQWICRL